MKFTRNRLSALFITVLAVLGQTACSQIPFFYNRAHIFIPTYIDTYVELNEQQRQLVAQEVKLIQHWHCKNQLPLYHHLLEKIDLQIKNKTLTTADIEHYEQQHWVLWEQLLTKSQPAVEKMLKSLNEKQIEDANQSFIKKNKSFIKKYIKTSKAKQQKAYARQLAKRIDDWTGKLNQGQKQLIVKASQRMKFDSQLSLNMRKNWQQALRRAMQNRAAQSFSAKIGQLWVRYSELWPAAYIESRKKNRKIIYQLLVNIHHSLTEKQKQYLQKRIRYWQTEISNVKCDRNIGSS